MKNKLLGKKLYESSLLHLLKSTLGYNYSYLVQSASELLNRGNPLQV